ncbi:uncharacterized protein LOC114535076 [Dendronephthya gigantea]|uniref:uncharacterized protein LOC114535076 n=1 Tax=Dendronephthya gigantea TaxID=151771 RepID=UPI00106BE7AC|nr:uncharacterized protein LOC114535076 [Dendronephthya gigantea]
MLPKLRKFLTRQSRSRSDKGEENGDVVLPTDLADQDNLFTEDPYRNRTGSMGDNIFNQELHFIVDYLGYSQVSEVQSISLLLESVKRVKKGCSEASRVDFVIKEGVLKISTVGCHALILTVPLYIVALCAQESLRGFDKCFGLNITRKNSHLCYVFQAGSSLEASSVVRSVALSFKSLGKMLRDRKEKMRLMRRRKNTPLYHPNSVESDWSSQTGYYNDSGFDPWQKFETWSRVSSTISRGTGNEQQRSSMSQKHSLNQSTSRRPPTHHSFKHVEFTALSPVPSHNSSIENRMNDINISRSKQDERSRESSNTVKRKGEFQIEVDVHTDVNQRLAKSERPDNSVVQESFLELSREESSSVLQNEDQSICMFEKPDIVDERIDMVLSAIRRGDVACVSSYLDDGVDVDLADSTRRTLLFHAVNYGQNAVVQLLLDRDASVNWEGPNDMSPLHQAAANKDKSIAQILLANGANVRAKDCEFRTPLHMCAGHPSGTELSCILVEHGARICDNTIDGTRPLDLLPDLKELQSRLVQSVCEAFIAADTSKSHSNSVTSSQSVQSGHSVFSGGSVVPHVGSLRHMHNQSPQMKHARHVSRRLTANFDVGSFQWKKDAKCMMDEATDENFREEDEIDAVNGTPCNACTTENIKETVGKSSLVNTSCEDQEDQNGHLASPTTNTRAKAPFSACETRELHENILAAHHKRTFVIGSIDTWAEGNAYEALMSSTPADGLLEETVKPCFGEEDNIQQFTAFGNSNDSGLHTKDETRSTVCAHQSILHNSKTCSETMRGRTRGDSVRFQDVVSPVKETDSGLGCSEGSPLPHEGKDMADRFRERARSNADSCYGSMAPCCCCKEDDPILIALNSLVKLSFNPECQPLLLSYLCLPKASSLLSVFARSPTAKQWVAEAVALLIKNLASIEGPDSRRRAAEAGFIRTVLQLAETQEPVQTTCLEVLDNLLKDVKCEREYNSTMTNIPSGPLLNLLHYQNDMESSSLHTGITEVADSSVGKKRKISRSQQETPVKLSPRLVATRLLAASSTHLKMQRELGSPRSVDLLLEALEERDAEIVHNAAVTLANIAMYDGNHSLLISSDAVESLKRCVPKDARAYYHVCRALVYLNCDEDDKCDYLFDFDQEEPRPLYTEKSPNQEPYIKGGSLESLVRILTTRAITLWGGVPLLSPTPKNRTRMKVAKRKSRATEEQVIEFFLATYSTYTNPIVLMRLLAHRFREPALNSLFDEETGVFKDQTRCLPFIHISLMRIWVAWLEKFPQDFRENSTLQIELGNLIDNLATRQGPYLVCAQHLESLLMHSQEDTSISLPPENHCHHDILFRSCQQAVLSGALPAKIDDAIYLAALQLYIELSSTGDQPNEKVFVTDVDLEKISTSRIKLCLNPAFHKVKNVYKRVRVYAEQIFREAPSQRKAKHDFIDCCQGMVAYGCKFFRVKEITCTTKSHTNRRLLGVSAQDVVVLDNKTKSVLKKWDLKSLLGWKCDESNGSLFLLFSESSFHFLCENKIERGRLQDTIKQCVYQRNCEGLNGKDFLPWTKRSEEKRNWGDKAMEEEINHRLENLSKSTKIFQNHDEWKSLSLLYMRPGVEEPRHRRHSSPSHRNSVKRNGKRNSVMYSNATVAAVDQAVNSLDEEDDDVCVPIMAYSVGTLDQRDGETSHLSKSQASTVQKSSVTTQSTFGQQSFLGNTSSYLNDSNIRKDQVYSTIDPICSPKLKICLCPPDAEFVRSEFTLLELLSYPRELARQITLIDHELFRNITTADILQRVSEGTNKKRKKGDENSQRTTVELFSDRFNQLSSWVVATLIKEESDQDTAYMMVQFIETAKQCLELRNYNAVMAIGVGALCSAPARRLRKAIPDLVPKRYLDQLHIMEVLMDSRDNYKKYRESLKICPSPAVPYFGVYLKDLIYISEGNPDYLNGGMVNLAKRRLLYAVLHQIRRFQVKSYNFEQVSEIQEFLLNTERYSDEELHRMSRKLDTSSRRTVSEASREVSMSVSGVSIA